MAERLCHLSEDEQSVLALMAWHYTDVQIAERLAMSEGTVHRRVADILHKLGVSDRREAARMWLAEQQGCPRLPC